MLKGDWTAGKEANIIFSQVAVGTTRWSLPRPESHHQELLSVGYEPSHLLGSTFFFFLSCSIDEI